jgi:hypothetical protein
MYETILAFCFAINIGGQPTNPCWMGKEETRFSTIEECEFYAERREAFVAQDIAKNYDVPPVVSVQCGPVQGRGS